MGGKVASRLGVVALLVLFCLAGKSAALDASEEQALLDFFTSNYLALNQLMTPWSSVPSAACGGATYPPWSGVTCTADRAHVTNIALTSIGLAGSIPDSIGGLTYLKSLNLRGNKLTGTVPSSLNSINSLTTLDLSRNSLSICGGDPLDNPSLTSCTLTSQSINDCIEGCCGCASAWSSSPCLADPPSCKPCTGLPPREVPYICSNGRWVVQGPYTGPLTVSGNVLLLGDYTVPVGAVTIFHGIESKLNVTGKVRVQEALTFVITEPDMTLLKTFGGLIRKQTVYMTAGVSQPVAGAIGGTHVRAAAQTKRQCLRPSTIVSGDTVTYTISYRYVNACNTWWIILLCFLPTIIGGLIGGLSSCFC